MDFEGDLKYWKVKRWRKLYIFSSYFYQVRGLLQYFELQLVIIQALNLYPGIPFAACSG